MSYKGIWLASVLALFTFALPVHANVKIDPAVGTWNLDQAKSKFGDPAKADKSQVRTYAATDGGLSVQVKTVDAAGTEHDSSTSFTYDGKKASVTNVPDYDTVSVKRINRGLSKTELIRDGKVIGHLVRVVSKDGKTLTLTITMTDAKGGKVHDVLVFDRQ